MRADADLDVEEESSSTDSDKSLNSENIEKDFKKAINILNRNAEEADPLSKPQEASKVDAKMPVSIA